MFIRRIAVAALCALAACSADVADDIRTTEGAPTSASDGGGEASEAPTVPFDIGEFPDTVTTEDITLTSAGVERTALVVAPAGVDPTGLPVIVALHGSGSEPYEHVVWTNTAGDPADRSYVAILPAGSISDGEGGYSWNVPGVTDAGGAPSDVHFLTDLAAWARERYATDAVYATGYSGGGRMISAVACTAPGTFDAIAPITGVRAGDPVVTGGDVEIDTASCAPERGTSILTVAGTDDPVNPYEGGGADYWGYGHGEALARWVEIDRCRTPDVETDGVVRTATYACADGERIVDVVVSGAGHVWAGSRAFERETSWAGAPSYAVDVNDLVWDFFSSVTR